MSELNNSTSEFEFVEETISEVENDTSEFEESTVEFVDKSEVLIFTNNFRIRGKIALVPGARLTDYIIEANMFIAVSDVEVKDKAGNFIFKTPFLDVHRDHIEIILPAELATMGETGSKLSN